MAEKTKWEMNEARYIQPLNKCPKFHISTVIISFRLYRRYVVKIALFSYLTFHKPSFKLRDIATTDYTYE